MTRFYIIFVSGLCGPLCQTQSSCSIASPVYHYIYSHVGQYSYTNTIKNWGGPFGVSHADDLFLLWSPHQHLGPIHLNPEDTVVSKRMLKWWTDFAKFGDPTPTPGPGEVAWTPVTQKDWKYLNISSDTPSMEYSGDYQGRIAFQMPWSFIT